MIDWRIIFNRFDQKGSVASVSEYNSSAIDMMAKFIAGIGDEVGVTYTTEGSGAPTANAEKFLKMLNYGSVKLWNYSLTYVDRMVRERNMPIYVQGYCGNNGHAWIIDGILYQNRTVQTRVVLTQVVVDSWMESRALLHCNFGWAGQCDGYYLADMFDNPREDPTHTEAGDLPGNSLSCYTTQKKCITWTTAW